MRGEVDEEMRKREPQSKSGQTWESHGVRLKYNILYQRTCSQYPTTRKKALLFQSN